MSARTIRVKVLGGRLAPLEELPLVEGSETTVVINLPEPNAPERKAHRLRTWNLGLGTKQVTRDDAYDDSV